MQAVAGELEQSIRKAEDRTGEIIERFSTVLDATCQRIRSALGETLGPVKKMECPDPDPFPVKDALKKLTWFAEESDSEGFEYLESIRGQLAAALAPEDLHDLEEALKAYNFPAALGTLRRLSEGAHDGNAR